MIAVVNPVSYFGLERLTANEVYTLFAEVGDYETVDLVVRAAEKPEDLLPSIRAMLRRRSVPSASARKGAGR